MVTGVIDKEACSIVINRLLIYCIVFFTKSHNAVHALFRVQKMANSRWGKTYSCVPFCPPSRAKNPNLIILQDTQKKNGILVESY